MTKTIISGRQRTRDPGLSLVFVTLLVFLCSSGAARATRLIATPFAETLAEGKTQVWQFLLRENRSTDEWRPLNRLDIGLSDRWELGVFIINPPRGSTDTWVNVQYRFTHETNETPVFSVGIWDIARTQEFSGEKIGGSFFVAAGKTVKPTIGGWSPRYLKLSLCAGTNRLNGPFGGVDLRFTDALGLFVEYAPPNLRLPNADSVDAALYYWVAPQWRARASWMGGNPMFDVLFTWTIGKK